MKSVPVKKTGQSSTISTCPASIFTQLGFASLLVLATLACVHAANTFENTGALAAGRSNNTATLLSNGKVLVVGGFNSTGGYLTSTELYDPATGKWSATGSLATARYAHTATLLNNGRVLIAGGYNDADGYLASVEIYDPGTGNWSAGGNLGTGRWLHTAVLLPNGKVLVAGGANGAGSLASAALYDRATNIWTNTGPLAAARKSHTATLLPSGKVLVAGGGNGAASITSAELYNPATGAWSGTGALAAARQSHTTTLLPDGKVLVAGGINGNSSVAGAQLYDPATGAWSTAGSPLKARAFHTATLLPNGKLLVAAGSNSTSGDLASTELYDPATNAWSSTGSLTTARLVPTATLLPSGRVLIAGGYSNSGGYLASAQLYDPAIGDWSTIGSLHESRASHTATLLPNGKVLVAGGAYYDLGNYLRPSAELYEPGSGNWTFTGSLAKARTDHTATLLPNGKVLVAAGLFRDDDDFSYLDDAELYDPADEIWTATGRLITERYKHTATLLQDGRVLVAGGRRSDGVLASAELYDPASSSWSATGTLVTARSFHTATLLPNGKVLVAGGLSNVSGSSGRLMSAELFDPATGTWSTTGPLVTARWAHTATLLPNGKILVTGVSGSPNAISPELYNSATSTWSVVGSPATPRGEHTATLLPNGKVLITGGQNSGSPSGSDLYDPATGTWSVTDTPAAARQTHTATLLPSGQVLVAGGAIGGYPNASAELYDVGLGFSGALQPQISSASFTAAGGLALTGSGFRGISSASGGNGGQDSPTNYPVVHLRRLDNEQSAFLLPDPTTTVSATGWTSEPIAPFSGHALLTVFANGIPSAAFLFLPGLPDIAVEQPVGTNIGDGGTQGFATLPGASVSRVFTIKNPGTGSLTGLTITKDGPNAGEFSVTTSPIAPVPPGGSTSFTIQSAPATSGAKTAAIHIANNVGGKNPYDINLTGKALSFSEDTDGDGLSDASEFQLVALGFDWQVSQAALVNALFNNANGAGLYTPSQVQALNVGVPLIQKNASTGAFTLTIGVKKATSLSQPFTDFPMNGPGTSTVIDGPGKLQFQFIVPDNAAFFRLEAQ